MKDKEKQFTSYDSQGPTDFDYVGFHLDTIEDLLILIDTCYKLFPCNKDNKVLIMSEKLDELKKYTSKLKRYVGQGPYHVYHSQKETLPNGKEGFVPREDHSVE